MKKRILIVLQSLPFPLNSGGRQGVFSCIEAIKDDLDVFLTCYNDPNADFAKNKLAKIWPNITILPYTLNKRKAEKSFLVKKFYKKIASKIFHNNANWHMDDIIDNRFNHFYAEYYEYINNLITSYDIDIVQLEFMGNISLFYSLPEKVKKVFVHHELGYIKDELLFKAKGFNTPYDKYILNLTRCNELDTLSHFDAVITHSSIDTQKLIDDGVRTNVFTSFSMVKLKGEQIPITSFKKRLTFIGPENHFPNKDGVTWFLNEIWPILKQHDNDWQFDIIGKWSAETKLFIEKKYDGVHCLGFVNELSAVLKESIMIVPIRIGSGIRMKLLEASNLGIPFVSTTVGAEGLPFKHKQDCLLADSVDSFVECILAMKELPLQRKLANNAFKMIKETFSKDKLKETRLVVYKKIFNQ